MTSQFIKDMVERAVKTFAQTLLASLTVAAAFEDVNWGAALSTATLGALTSLLTSIVSGNIGDSDTASLVDKKGQKR